MTANRRRRNAFDALAVTALATLVASCGGGSASTATAVPATSTALTPIANTSSSGPTSTITVSIAKTPQSAAAPVAAVRAAAQKRSPAYVSSNTGSMEFVLLSGSTVLVDDLTACSPQAAQCSGTFTVPIGSGFTASLFLYDGYDDLLSAGTVANVRVVSGTNPTLTIALSGVVASFNVTTTANPFFGTVPQSFTVSVIPQDADGNTINNVSNTAAPLIDQNLDAITHVTLTPAENLNGGSYVTPTDISPSGSTTLTPSASLTFPATSYSFSGTGNETNVQWTANEVAGAQVVSATGATGPYGSGWNNSSGTATGVLNETVTAPLLSWVSQLPTNYTTGEPVFTTTSTTMTDSTSAQLEFPLPENSGTYYVSLSENVPYTGNVTISDNGRCGGITTSYTPALGTHPLAALANPPYFGISLGTHNSSNICVIEATDAASPARTAYLTIDVDNSTLTIQNAGRK